VLHPHDVPQQFRQLFRGGGEGLGPKRFLAAAINPMAAVGRSGSADV
jgi:hypothetical protein